MVEVYHVQGKELKKLSGDSFEFLNGDVYLVKHGFKLFIWLGSKSFADDRAVGAWAAQVLDLENDDYQIRTEPEGNESEEFKQLVNFKVVEGDTPGFLKSVPRKVIEFKMYRVRDVDLTDLSSSDDIEISEVPISRSSLDSSDVFVIDGYDIIYVWIGKNSQVGEKAAGNRLARKLDVERHRNPIVYVIHEGDEPPKFFDFLEKIARESKMSETGEKVTKTSSEKKSFWSKLKFW